MNYYFVVFEDPVGPEITLQQLVTVAGSSGCIADGRRLQSPSQDSIIRARCILFAMGAKYSNVGTYTAA